MFAKLIYTPIIFLGLVFFAAPVFACSVCFVGKEGSMVAYYSTAIFLSSLPFTMVGLFVWFYRRHQQKMSHSTNDFLEKNESIHIHQKSVAS